MRVHTEPPLRDWPRLAGDKPIVTGHQPWLWHPGILAKYLAADAAMAAAGLASDVSLRHVVVDQDVQDATRLALPARDGDRLSVHHTRLGPGRVDIPTGCQPAVQLELDNVPDAVAVDVTPLREVLSEAPNSRDATRPRGSAAPHNTPADHDQPPLADRLTALLHALMQPLLGRPAEAFYATRFDAEPWFADELGRLLHDAPSCVNHYNRAVATVGRGAGVAPLSAEPYRVELPLWKLGWMRPRERVYADLADSTPLFTTADGQPFNPDDPAVILAPRALLMTAWIRRRPDVGLFVHGTGGWRYDRITEAWWQAWRQEPLAPMALATADAYLEFDVPVNGRDAVTRAVWRAHHRPHNLDRLPGLDGPLASEKDILLRHMDDDRDKPRRRTAFRRVHAINEALAATPPGLAALADAEADLVRARLGLHNAAVAARRDWAFPLYPERALHALRDAIRADAAGGP